MPCARDAEHRNTRKDKLKNNKKHPYRKGGHGRVKWLPKKRIE